MNTDRTDSLKAFYITLEINANIVKIRVNL